MMRGQKGLNCPQGVTGLELRDFPDDEGTEAPSMVCLSERTTSLRDFPDDEGPTAFARPSCASHA